MPYKDPEARRAYHRAYRAKNADNMVAQRRAWDLTNVECQAEYARIYRAEHAERIAAYKRVWYLANVETELAKGRARYVANPQRYIDARNRRQAVKQGNLDNRCVTKWELTRLLNRQRGRCFYCSVETALTKEHVVPISRGGRHAIGNLVLVCGPCNDGKHKLTLMEWKRRRGWLGRIPPFRCS